ncbi:MAG TPA: hypothetical protein VGD40_12025 [Chryseosolibacter sp.]
MIFFKAFFLFGPLLFLPMNRGWTKPQKQVIRIVFVVWLIVLVFTPFSFRGWIIDYIIFFCTAALALSTLSLEKRQQWVILGSVASVICIIIYCFVASKFGGRLLEEYSRGTLAYRLYEVPDMVTAPTYSLYVDEVHGPFEKHLLEKTVLPTPCRFDYVPRANRLITTDSCSQSERSVFRSGLTR